MTVQYHFTVSCKKITETKWIVQMQSTGREVPMPIVQPESNTDSVLTTDPIVQEITDPHAMTCYLRQLNHRRGSRSSGHNDVVIWNLSNRFPKLQIGQQLTVSISYFEGEGFRSGTYEIRSKGIFPRVSPNRRSTPQPSSTFTAPAGFPRTSFNLNEIKSRLARTAASAIHASPQVQNAEIPQEICNLTTNLVTYVEQLQQGLLTAQNTLQSHETLLRRMEERIKRLEAENRQLQEIRDTQDTILQSLLPKLKDFSASQTPASSEETDEDVIATEAPSLFEQIAKS